MRRWGTVPFDKKVSKVYELSIWTQKMKLIIIQWDQLHKTGLEGQQLKGMVL